MNLQLLLWAQNDFTTQWVRWRETISQCKLKTKQTYVWENIVGVFRGQTIYENKINNKHKHEKKKTSKHQTCAVGAWLHLPFAKSRGNFGEKARPSGVRRITGCATSSRILQCRVVSRPGLSCGAMLWRDVVDVMIGGRDACDGEVRARRKWKHWVRVSFWREIHYRKIECTFGWCCLLVCKHSKSLLLLQKGVHKQTKNNKSIRFYFVKNN